MMAKAINLLKFGSKSIYSSMALGCQKRSYAAGFYGDPKDIEDAEERIQLWPDSSVAPFRKLPENCKLYFHLKV
jgi:hypothetical protein